jgi:isopenicillin N synthase-like dioxygenase
MRKRILNLKDFSSSESRSARHGLLTALSRDGCCLIESDGSSHALAGLLSELSKFFRSACHQDKSYLSLYRHGILRGYFPPLDPASRKLELRKERYVFGKDGNVFPGNQPLLKHAYHALFANHVQPIADVVYESLAGYLEETRHDWAVNFRRFFLNPYSGELEPSVLGYAMHYLSLEDPHEFLNPDQTVTISDPHVDMSTFTVLPRGTIGGTKTFDSTGRIVSIYDGSVPPDAIVVFVGKILEKLLEGIPFTSAHGTCHFRAFRHAVMNTPAEARHDRDVVGYFFNGNVARQYIAVANARQFGSMFIDRRPLAMKQLEPLSGAELTVKDRQYLTERLFFSADSPNSASPPVTLQQFRSVN